MSDDSKLQSLTEIVERFMPFDNWGFKQSARFFGDRPDRISSSGVEHSPTVIYDSPYCRVKFLIDTTGIGRNMGLHVFYARLHAPTHGKLMNWKGEDCYCWHWDVHQLILKFLDGNSPAEAVAKRGKDPEGLKEFRKLGLEKAIDDFEYPARYHTAIWTFYGDRFFELFDLRRPELWEQYVQFVREFYDKHRRSRNVQPPLDKIC